MLYIGTKKQKRAIMLCLTNVSSLKSLYAGKPISETKINLNLAEKELKKAIKSKLPVIVDLEKYTSLVAHVRNSAQQDFKESIEEDSSTQTRMHFIKEFNKSTDAD